MALYFGTTEITNIDNLIPQTGLDITDMWLGGTNVYTVWQTYEGTLPATLNANGDDMRQYQIWGNTGGVGEEVDITGLSEPLCGIGAYTDSLDLSTGILTRRINKLVLTGQEPWFYRSGNPPSVFFFELAGVKCVNNLGLCTHYPNQQSGSFSTLEDKHFLVRLAADRTKTYISIRDSSPFSTLSDFKAYIAQFYTNGNPITVWFAHEEPEVSTITIPSGLTGTLEGYLIQDGTPTPETPIYPTANGVKQADDTYSIKYGYKLDMSVSDGTTSTITPIYIGSDPLDKDEYVDYQVGKVFKLVSYPFSPTIEVGSINVSNGENIDSSTTRLRTNFTEGMQSAGVYTINTDGNVSQCAILVYDENRTYMINESVRTWIDMPLKFELSAPRYVRFTFRKDNSTALLPSDIYEILLKQLQPTDPPVPLPALPTCEGTTNVDYAGQSVVPEKMLLKYRKKNF